MFANSGIPLLQKLADYYTEINGTKVSASQVRGMITGREVSFEDVKKVLWDMTEAGGQFYNMQEVMAESLASKWRNLGNAWNLMLTNMAEGWTGSTLKGLAEFLTKMTESYKTLGPAILASIPPIIAWKAAVTAAGGSASFLQLKRVDMLKSSIKGLGDLLRGISKATLTNPFMWAAAAAAAAAGAIMHFVNAYKEIDEVSKKLEEKGSEGFENIGETLKNHNIDQIADMSSFQIEDGVKELKEELKKYDPLWEDTFRTIFEKTEKEGKYVNDLATQYKMLIERLHATKDAYKELRDSDYMDASQWDHKTDGWFWGVFGDSFTQNAEKMSKKYNEAMVEMRKIVNKGYNESLTELSSAVDTIEFQVTHNESEKVQQQWKEIKASIEAASDPLEKWTKLVEGFAKSDIDGGSVLRSSTRDIMEILGDLGKERTQMSKDANTIAKEILGNLQSAGKISENINLKTKDGIEKAAKAAHNVYNTLDKRTIAMNINALIDKAGVPEGLRESVFNNVWEKVFTVKYEFKYDDSEKKELSAYQKAAASPLKEVKNYDEITDALGNTIKKYRKLTAAEQAMQSMWKIVEKSSDPSTLADNLQKEYDKAIKDMKKYQDKMNAKLGGEVTQAVLDQAKRDFERTKELVKWTKKYAEEVADAGGIQLQLKGQGNNGSGNRDTELEELKKDYQQYKTIWQDFKSLSEKYGTEDAWEQVMGTDAWKRVESLSGVKNQKEFLKVTEKFQAMVDELLKSPTTNNNNRESRKQFWQTIFKDLLGMENDILKPEINAAKAEIERQLDEMKIQYSFSKQIFDLTGDKQYAYDYINSIVLAINDRLKETDIDFSSLLEMDSNSLKAVVKADQIAAVESLIKAYKDAEKDQIKRSQDFMLEGIKMTQSYEEKRLAIINKYNELIKNAESKAVADRLRILQSEELVVNDKVYSRMFETTSLKNIADIRKQFKNVRDAYNSIMNNGHKYYKDGILQGIFNDGKYYKTEEIDKLREQIDKLGNDTDKVAQSFKNLWKYINGKETAKGKLKFADIAEDLGNIIDNTVKVSDAFSELANALGRGSLGSALSLFSSIGNSLKQMSTGISEFTSGNKIGGLTSTVSGMASLANAISQVRQAEATKKYEQEMSAAKGLISTYDKLISEKEKFISISGSQVLAGEKQDAVSLLQGQVDAYKRQFETFVSGYWDRKSIHNHTIGVELARDLRKYEDEVRKVLGNATTDKLYSEGEGGNKNRMRGLLELTADELKKLRDETRDTFWATLPAEIQEILNSVIDGTAKIEDIINAVDEQLTQISTDSLASNFIDSLMTMDSAAEDFTEDLNEMFMRAMLTDWFNNEMREKMDKWHKQWADYMESDNELTDAERDALRRDYEAMVQEGIAKRNELADLTGYTGETSSSGLSAAVKGVTEETANILAGLLNGVRGDTSIQREVMEQLYYVELPKMNAIAESQLVQLNMIAENTRLNAEYALMCADAAEDISGTLRDVTTGVKKFSIE